MGRNTLKTGISYFGNRYLRHVRKDMHDIKQNHCNFVVHTFSEIDLEFYRETMKDIVAASHKEGLEVYMDPWALGGIFGGESFSQFVNKNLDTRQISQRGESVPAACINNPKFRKFMKKWIDAAIDIGGDVIFWDEPHYYIFGKNWTEAEEDRDWACRCAQCRECFSKKHGKSMPRKLTRQVRSFRQDSMINFLQEMMRYVVKRGKVNAMCFLPRIKPIGGIESWDDVIKRLPDVKIVGTDPYWPQDVKSAYDYVRDFSDKIVGLCRKHKKIPQIWILNFYIKKGTEYRVTEAVKAAHDAGVRNIAAWSYRGTEAMSNLACDNPDLVWKTLGAAYHKIQY